MIPQDPWMIQASKKIAASIIDKLGPDDLTAVVFTGDNRKTQDFTNDKTKLRAALDKFNPGLASYRFGADTPNVDTDLWFYQSAIRTLSDLADYLVQAPGRRKALFWVSPGVPMDIEGWLFDGRAIAHLVSRDYVELTQRTGEVFRRAQRANVRIYPIDPSGLGGMQAYLGPRLVKLPGADQLVHAKVNALQDFLAATAANTGGRTVMNINDFEPGITEVFEENKSYYLIGFEPTNTAADGKLRTIEVKVNRPNVDVRTSSSYYAPEPENIDKKPNAKETVTPEAAELAKAIGGILPNGGLPLRVAVAPFAVPGQRLAAVTIVLGVRQPVPAAAAKARVTETTELQIGAFTPEGDPKGTQRHTAEVVLRAGADGDAAYEVLGRIDLPAGRYRLRLAATNATAGKTGSVFADVTVTDYSNVPFSASPVVLAATPGRVSAPKDLLATLIPLVPTAERVFATSDRVTAFLRLYQSGQKPIERAQVETTIDKFRSNVSEVRTIGTAQFTSAGEQVTPTASPGSSQARPQGVAGVLAGPATDRFANLALRTADVRYQVPLAGLTPGPHLLTFEATIGATTIRRDVRFEVK